MATGPERRRDRRQWEIYHDLPTCDEVGTRIEVIQPIRFIRDRSQL
ncbi:hypothetical protein OHA18_41980 [Kribbella sp. NBC_00709]|nr:hypothetical protein [Kribbella sp. NBC_00709]